MAKKRIKGTGMTRGEKAEEVIAALEEDTLEFVFKLEGGLRDLNVFELVPTLQSMAVALREANRTIFPESPDLSVGVRPIEEGSYEIRYALSYIHAHLPLFASTGANAVAGIHQISEVLGDLGVIKRAGLGVLGVIRRLSGRPKSIDQIGSDEYRAESENGSAVVSGNVKNLLQNPIIIENLNVTYGGPISKPSVSDVKTYLQRDPAGSTITVTKELAGVLDKYVRELNKPGDETKENVATVWLNPHRGPFTGEPGQWWFKRGGGKPFPATIKDKSFLESYGQGEPRLNSEDLLEVELLERQKVSDGKLTTSYTILKVTGYRAGAQKRRLPFESKKTGGKRKRS